MHKLVYNLEEHPGQWSIYSPDYNVHLHSPAAQISHTNGRPSYNPAERPCQSNTYALDYVAHLYTLAVHPRYLKTRFNIAGCTGETGDAKLALELLNALLPDQEKVLGKTHPDTLRTFKQIEHWQFIVDRE